MKRQNKSMYMIYMHVYINMYVERGATRCDQSFFLNRADMALLPSSKQTKIKTTSWYMLLLDCVWKK